MSSARPSESAATAKLWFWLVISIAPVVRSLHRVVGAVVAERQLDRLAAEGPAEQLVAEADAEHRDLRRAGRGWLDGVGHLGRVAGPLDRNTPSGSRARTSAAGVDAGTTSTVPRPARWRRIVRLMPKS